MIDRHGRASRNATDEERETALQRRVQRGAMCLALYAGGATLDEIAAAQTPRISRERVRQLIGIARAAGHNYGDRAYTMQTLDVLRGMRALRDPSTHTVMDLQQHGGQSIRYALEVLGVWPAALRLLRARQRKRRSTTNAWNRERIITELRALVDADGVPIQTKTIQDEHPGLFGMIYRYFPSIEQARLAAGFPPSLAIKHRYAGKTYDQPLRRVDYGD
jgi:hypothetical protein